MPGLPHPFAFLGVGAVVGFVVGLLIGLVL